MLEYGLYALPVSESSLLPDVELLPYGLETPEDDPVPKELPGELVEVVELLDEEFAGRFRMLDDDPAVLDDEVDGGDFFLSSLLPLPFPFLSSPFFCFFFLFTYI